MTRLFLLALTLRLAWLAVFIHRGLASIYKPDLYYSLARSWAGLAPMPAFDATHPPLYTAFLAAILVLTHSPLAALLIQCVMGAASVLLAYKIGERLMGPQMVCLGATWMAIDPALVFFTPQFQTETLFVFLMLLFMLGLLVALDGPMKDRVVTLGFLGGLCALCRSVFAAYPAFLFMALWRERGRRFAIIFCAMLIHGWILPPGLWAYRNYHRYGRVVPLSAQMGWTLYEGFTLDREEVRRRPAEMQAEADRLGLKDPMATGDYFAAKTIRLIREHPLASAHVVAGKALLFWRPFPYDPYTGWQRNALGIYYLVLFAFALIGAFSAGPGWAPIWALFAYLTCAHSLFFTSLRYRLPLEPFLCLLAGQGLGSVMLMTPVKARQWSHCLRYLHQRHNAAGWIGCECGVGFNGEKPAHVVSARPHWRPR